MKKAWGILLGLAALPAPWTASADIVFLNLNNAPSEVAAARAAAAQRGERLVVVPENEVTPNYKAAFNRASEESERLQTLRSRAFANLRDARASGDEKLEEQYQAEIDRYEAEDKALREKFNQENAAFQFSLEKLERKLRQMKEQGHSVSTVIVSGHSQGTSYFGELTGGEIDAQAIGNVFKVAGIHEDVKSLYLWGCYSATANAVRHQREFYPNADLVAGFDAQGPSSQRPESGRIMKALLTEEARVREEKDKARLVALLQKLSPYKKISTVVAVGDQYCRVPRGTVVPFSSDIDDCEQISHFMVGLDNMIFDPYMAASDEGHADPPDPKTNPSNELRSYYNNLQLVQHCSPAYSRRVNQVLALMFFKNVKLNFARFYRTQIEDFNRLVQEIGTAGVKCKPFPALESPDTRRKEVVTAVEEIRKCEERIRKSGLEFDYMESLYKAQSKLSLLQDLVCIPPAWVLEGGTLTDPSDLPGCEYLK